jgi:hypothetical protein
MSLRVQCIMKNELVGYYLVQAGRGSLLGDRTCLFCTTLPSTRTWDRGFLSNLFRLVRPLLWSGIKAVGRESLRTGSKILTDIADTESKPRDIIAKHVGESAQNLIQKLRGRGSKRSPPTEPTF